MASQTVPPPPVCFQPSPNQVLPAKRLKGPSEAAPSGLPCAFGVVKKRQASLPVMAS
jgi:hypothetical protein